MTNMNDAITSLRSLAARYLIEREIGRGGMATVFLAQDLKHHRQVAVKVLKPELTVSLGAERFLREIETTANLRHPHILPLYDSGEIDGALYYVMPFVEGESLRDRLEREGQLPLDDAIRIAREVAGALSYAHARGIIHRDIKPENILLESGHAVVTDFGIARAVRAAGRESLTGAGVSLGTPAYMSPEQAAGDARSRRPQRPLLVRLRAVRDDRRPSAIHRHHGLVGRPTAHVVRAEPDRRAAAGRPAVGGRRTRALAGKESGGSLQPRIAIRERAAYGRAHAGSGRPGGRGAPAGQSAIARRRADHADSRGARRPACGGPDDCDLAASHSLIDSSNDGRCSSCSSAQPCHLKRAMDNAPVFDSPATRSVAPTTTPFALGLRGVIVMGTIAAATTCMQPGPPSAPPAYTPRTRALTVTTVPLLVKEEQSVFPFLKPAMARGGVLEGKEVYAFSPSTVTVVEGDTIRFTFINPEDDVHSFVLPDFAVSLPGGKTTEATYIAKRAGLFTFQCAIASHLPMMVGQLVVLPAASMAGAEVAATSAAK